MPYRTGNYVAFYVAEPFFETNLGACAAKDFCYYNMLKAWKAADSSFPFVNSHDKTYSVRDGSDWEKTLKPRLHQRLNASKNVILFLSSNTKYSRALKEEIDYAINTLRLQIIVVYPDYSLKTDIAGDSGIRQQIQNLWDKLPVLRDNMDKVATLHIPCAKESIKLALSDPDLMVQTMKPGTYYHKI
ncbi:MAG: TIR domain-containing protein [Prevotellaceae bacterium]|nr:TIR domain-containing protein [Candidatus Faecinaster equi]